MAAAEAVGAGEEIAPEDVLELLGRLVAQSLVAADRDQNGVVRHRFLETVRQYSRQLLVASGQVAAVRDRHAVYFLTLAQEAASHVWELEQQTVWLDRLSQDQDNLCIALDWLTERRDAERGAPLATTLLRFWLRGSVTEGRERLRQLLALGVPLHPRTRAGALRAAARLAWAQGDYAERRTLGEQSLALYREIDDSQGVALCLQDLGSTSIHQGDYVVARTSYEESIQLLRAVAAGERSPQTASSPTLGVRTYLAHSQLGLANVARDLADFSTAQRLYREALEAIAPTERSAVLDHKAWHALYRGAFKRARALVGESIVFERKLGRVRDMVVSRTLLGRIAFAEGADAEAVALYADSLHVHREYGNRWGVALVLEGLAAILARSQPSLALRLAGAAAELRAQMGRPLPPVEQPILARWLTSARQKLGQSAQVEAWASGGRLQPDDLFTEVAAAIRLIPTTIPAAPGNRPRELSRRELEVACLIAEGCSNRQVGEKLVITESTVQRHVANILAKLSLHSRAQAAVWAVARDCHSS